MQSIKYVLLLLIAGAMTSFGVGAPPTPRMYFADTVSGKAFSKDPAVVRFKDKYWLYYSIPAYQGKVGSGWTIGVATSDNLVDWTKAGELHNTGEVEQKGFTAPGAIVLNNKVHLFYQAYGNEKNDAICHAWSDDGLNFTRDPSNPIFHPTGDWTSGRAIDADVIVFKDKLLLYWATRDPEMKIQMQGVSAAPLDSDFSRDTWKQLNADRPILEPTVPTPLDDARYDLRWEGKCIEAAAMALHDGRLYMFYAGNYNNAPQQVGVAVSDDGVNFKRLSDKPLIPNGPPGSWNHSESGHPFLFQDDDGRDYLFYQGNNDRGKTWYLSVLPIRWIDGKPVPSPEMLPPQDNDPHADTDTLDLRSMIQPLDPAKNITREDDWYWWGGGAVRGEDGKYHLFCARWPRKHTFRSWLTHSEVAHAVSDEPAGPYRYVDTALSCRGQYDWNQVTAHNPKIKTFDGRHYIYFISTHLDASEQELIEVASKGDSDPRWEILRNNQRTGAAVADSLGGPWRCTEKAIIEPGGPIENVTVNPGVCRGPDGRYVMIVKGDKPGSTQRSQAIATADNPVGPWTYEPKAAIDSFDTEDASIWYDKSRKRFYAVYHDHKGISMITSTDGRNWLPARHQKVLPKSIPTTEGRTLEPVRLERPFVLTDDEGLPLVLFCAIRTKDGDSANIHLSLKDPGD